MRRLFILILITSFVVTVYSFASDVELQLRGRYEGKTFLLRGFPSGDWLVYNSAGDLVKYETPGDWTSDGFVLAEKVAVSNDRLLIDGRRLLVLVDKTGFQLRPAEQSGTDNKEPTPTRVRIEVELSGNHPSPEQVNGALARVFFTENDSLASSAPAYWRSCVQDGLLGKNLNCRFSKDLSAIPGVAPSRQGIAGSTSRQASSGTAIAPTTDDLPDSLSDHPFRMGDGATPPKVLHSPEPEYSNAARGVKYQGTVSLGLIVDQEGVPNRIRILRPLGAGLDAKAVDEVKTWRFEPAYKDGRPVSFMLGVEVNFQLY